MGCLVQRILTDTRHNLIKEPWHLSDFCLRNEHTLKIVTHSQQHIHWIFEAYKIQCNKRDTVIKHTSSDKLTYLQGRTYKCMI